MIFVFSHWKMVYRRISKRWERGATVAGQCLLSHFCPHFTTENRHINLCLCYWGKSFDWEKRILLLKEKKMIRNCWPKWSLAISFSSLRLWLLTNIGHYAYQFSHIRYWGIKVLKDFAWNAGWEDIKVLNKACYSTTTLKFHKPDLIV